MKALNIGLLIVMALILLVKIGKHSAREAQYEKSEATQEREKRIAEARKESVDNINAQIAQDMADYEALVRAEEEAKAAESTSQEKPQ